MADGHSAGQIILQLHDHIVPSDTLNDRQKSTICERLAVSSLGALRLLVYLSDFNFELLWRMLQGSWLS